MTKIDRWLLPEGIEELLPPRARMLERLRRRLLDRYDSWGYELVMPPFIEYLDSLLTGAGEDLDLQTFKVIDSITGRLMGVRADMTPQAARIDAHSMRRDEPVRLCYLGTVLHTRPEGLSGSRAPLQIGAELYGHGGIDSDMEVLELMLETLELTEVGDVHVDLGHVGIFRGLAQQAGLDHEIEAELFGALQRKAVPEVESLLAGRALSEAQRGMLLALAELNGGEEVLEQAREVLAGAEVQVHRALDDLGRIAERMRQRQVPAPLHFDLAELRGYNYQTGVVFAAFVPGHGQEIARGGRYDDIGRIFGRARPATGFSADLKTLVEVSGSLPAYGGRDAIFAPAVSDAELRRKVRELRAGGERVVCGLAGQRAGAQEMGCSRTLEQHDGRWMVVALGNEK